MHFTEGSAYSNRTVSWLRVTDNSIKVYQFFCDLLFLDKQGIIVWFKNSSQYASIMLESA